MVAMEGGFSTKALTQYRTLLVGSLLVLLLVVLSVAYIAWRSANEAIEAIERTQLTHQVLEALLRVRVDTNRLLTDLTMVALAGASGGLSEGQAEARIRADIARVREGISQQVAAVAAQQPVDGAPELAKLRQVEAAIEALVGEYDQVSRLLTDGRRDEAIQRIVAAVDKQGEGGGLARNFRSAIQAAIDQEEQTVRAADERAKATLTGSARATRIAAVAGLLFAAISIAVLLRRLRRPLRQLSEVASAVAQGDIASRVAVAGDDEFARVGRVINGMLDELQAARDTLEATVASRTAELSQANAALRATDAVRRRFLADISHELRTPLTIIRGEAEVALRAAVPAGSTEPAVRATLHRIVEQAEHTAQLVNDLLFIARSDADKLRLNTEPTPFDELVAAACTDSRALSRDRAIEVQYKRRQPAAVVDGDPVRLRQLLHILLDNAKRYGDEGSRITVSLEPTDTGLRLSVCDVGPGIPRDELPHVFDRFYRGANAADREGSGLGLTMAKAIVEAHRGRIRIDSEAGRGTLVEVDLPGHVVPPDASEMAMPVAASETGDIRPEPAR